MGLRNYSSGQVTNWWPPAVFLASLARRRRCPFHREASGKEAVDSMKPVVGVAGHTAGIVRIYKGVP